VERILIAVIALAAVFGGYREYQRLASPGISAQAAADRVGAVYGDPHAHIVREVTGSSEGPASEPLYSLTVTGHFREGSRTARYLEFTASAVGGYACCLWAATAWPIAHSRTVLRQVLRSP
jgi:hypothetical protein